MKNKLAKLFILIPLLALSSCGKSDNTPIETGLKGKFKNSTSLQVYYKRTISTSDRFLYATSYPLNNLTNFGVYEDLSQDQINKKEMSFTYSWDQTLTLNKDNTYHYVFTITFGNPGNCPDMMSVNADYYGTYLYSKLDDNNYVIDLSSPNKGKEEIYACNFSINELFWFGGGITAKHSSPDKVIDFELDALAGRYETSWYSRSRTIKTTYDFENQSNNSIVDDLFDQYFLDHVGQYCTY
jgi:outer membrane lipoprotein-sorting protein